MATKFSPVTHVDPLDRVECQNFENFKSQDGGGRYSKKKSKKIASLADRHHPTPSILPNKMQIL